MLADVSKTARISVIVLFPLLFFRCIFHIIFYYSSSKRNMMDIELNQELIEYKINYKIHLLSFIWACVYNPFWRSLFFYRIGPSKASICKIFTSDNSGFIIVCRNMGTIKMFHPFATIINAKSIGSNLQIRNSTTIGNTHNSQDNRPIIGNNVNIGANVVIIGNITIGDNVTIGAGSLINKDIPDNAIVVGNPFRIIGYNENTRN